MASEDAPLSRRGSSSSRTSLPVVIPSSHLDSALHLKAAEVTRKRHLEEQLASLVDGNHDDDLMTPPEVLLERSLKLAEQLEIHVGDLQEGMTSGIVDCWSRSIPLARIVHGDTHWILAKAHIQLGRAYLLFKGLYQQALLHAVKGFNILVAPGSHVMSHDPPPDAICQLASAHCVIGGAYTVQGKLPKAESELIKARKIFLGLSDTDIKLETDIFTAFAWLNLKQEKFAPSRKHFSKAINVIKTAFGPNTSKLLPLFRGRATTEMHLSLYEAAIESLHSAILIAETSYGTGSEVVAEITQAQGKVGVAQLRGGVLVDTDGVEDKFLQAITMFTSLSEPNHKKTLSCKEELCLMLASQSENQKRAIPLIRELLAAKKEIYGESDIEVGHTLKLLATVLLAQGKIDQASTYLKQAKDVYSCSLGTNHKEILALSRSLESISGSAHSPDQKKPIFKTVFLKHLSLQY